MVEGTRQLRGETSSPGCRNTRSGLTSATGLGTWGMARSKKEGFLPEDRRALETTCPGIGGDIPTERLRFKPKRHSPTFLFWTLPLALSADGSRAGAFPQAEHAAGAEHHGAVAETARHGPGDAQREAEGAMVSSAWLCGQLASVRHIQPAANIQPRFSLLPCSQACQRSGPGRWRRLSPSGTIK